MGDCETGCLEVTLECKDLVLYSMLFERLFHELQYQVMALYFCTTQSGSSVNYNKQLMTVTISDNHFRELNHKHHSVKIKTEST